MCTGVVTVEPGGGYIDPKEAVNSVEYFEGGCSIRGLLSMPLVDYRHLCFRSQMASSRNIVHALKLVSDITDTPSHRCITCHFDSYPAGNIS